MRTSNGASRATASMPVRDATPNIESEKAVTAAITITTSTMAANT
jgi:hypothetical protein